MEKCTNSFNLGGHLAYPWVPTHKGHWWASIVLVFSTVGTSLPLSTAFYWIGRWGESFWLPVQLSIWVHEKVLVWLSPYFSPSPLRQCHLKLFRESGVKNAALSRQLARHRLLPPSCEERNFLSRRCRTHKRVHRQSKSLQCVQVQLFGPIHLWREATQQSAVAAACFLIGPSDSPDDHRMAPSRRVENHWPRLH